MKLTVNSKDLLNAVSLVGNCVRQKNIIPILDNLLFEFSENKLTLTGSSLDIFSKIEIVIECKDVKSFCVPYFLFNNILKSFPNTSIDLIFDNNSLMVKSKDSKYTLPIFDFKEFPKIKETEFIQTISFDSCDFIFHLKNALKFIPSDGYNNFDNLFIYIYENKTIITGGNNNLFYSSEIELKGVECKLLIPKTSVDYISKTINEDEEIEVSYNQSFLRINTKEKSIYLNLSNGNYHDFQKVIDNQKPTSNLHVDKEHILSCIKRIYSIVSSENTSLKFSVLENKLTLEIDDVNNSLTAKEVIDCNFDLENIVFGLKIDNVITSLNSLIYDETVNFGIVSEVRGCIINSNKTTICLGSVKLND